MSFKNLLTASLLFITSAAFGQDISKLLEIENLKTKGGIVSWENANSFEAFDGNHRDPVTSLAHACGTISGAELKSKITERFSTFIKNKSDLQTILNDSLADEATYQACSVDVILNLPSAGGVESDSFVFTVIDPITAQEVVLGLYVEYT